MKIPINKDISTYKQDFWKGMSLREVLTVILLSVLNIGGVIIGVLILGIPVVAIIYIMLPLNALIGMIGFFPTKRLGMGLIEYLKTCWNVKFSETKIYESQEFTKEMDIRYFADSNPKDTSKKSEKRKGE